MKKTLYLGAFLVTVCLFGHTPPVNAATFDPGNIIDNVTMSSQNTMTFYQIQDFINGKMPACDTNGTQPASDYGRPDLTHAQYAALRGWQSPPYICLKNFTENGLTPAQIIYNAAQAKHINPQVLLVTLQKESSLITDTWPLNSQYRTAMGYGCPDSGPNNSANCNSNYFGFTNQINWAATLYRAVLDQSPTWYSPYVVGSNYIQWNPQSSCGGSTVNIQNLATAALYDYTPYQPNQAALNAGWGQGDGCSSYGNRNFYLYYNAWFNFVDSIKSGVTIGINPRVPTSVAVGQNVTYNYSITNTLGYSITLDSVGVVGRAGTYTGANRDFGWKGPVTITAGQTYQFSATTTIRDTSTLYMWPAIVYSNTYIQYNQWGDTLSSHMPNFSVTQAPTPGSGTIYAGQKVALTAKVKNNEPYPINYDAFGIPVKYHNTYNYDAAWVGAGTVASGAEITLTGTTTLDKPGPYTYWVSDFFNGAYSTIGQTNTFTVVTPTPSFTVSGQTFSPSVPIVGSSLSSTFSVTNTLPVLMTVSSVGVVGRYNTYTGPNRDLGWQGPVQFAPNETKTFTISGKVTDLGTLYYWIGLLYNGSYIQYNTLGNTFTSQNPGFAAGPITLSPTPFTSGQTLTASVTLTNKLSVAYSVDSVGIVGRLGSRTGPNRDLGWQGTVQFAPNETKTFSFSNIVSDRGTLYYWVGVGYNGTYLQYQSSGTTLVSN